MFTKRFGAALILIAVFCTVALTGCGKSSNGLTQAEQQQMKNPPAPGSTPPPEARAAIARMQSAPKGGPPPAK